MLAVRMLGVCCHRLWKGKRTGLHALVWQAGNNDSTVFNLCAAALLAHVGLQLGFAVRWSLVAVLHSAGWHLQRSCLSNPCNTSIAA